MDKYEKWLIENGHGNMVISGTEKRGYYYTSDAMKDYESEMSAMCKAESNVVLGEEPATLSIDDMKCCGNCHHRESMDNGDDFIECCSKRNSMASWQVCDKWRYDKVSEKHRGGVVCF